MKESFLDYVIIVNIHWGIEDIRYPEPKKRVLAHKFIDIGVDLIIGHHPHNYSVDESYHLRSIDSSIQTYQFWFKGYELLLLGKRIMSFIGIILRDR